MIRTGIYACEEEPWLKARLDYLTGSDVGIACNVSKWKARGQLVMEKAGLAENDFERNEQQELGHDIEPMLARVATRRWRWDLHVCGELLVDSHCPDLAATPDYLMQTPWGLAVVQCKATTAKATEDLRPVLKDGTKSKASYAFGPPLDYVLQVHSEMAVVGAQLGCLLVGHFSPPGFKVRAYPVLRSEIVIARIRSEAVALMSDVRKLRRGEVA